MNRAYVKEFFKSIQGEGTYIGYKQLFIRFCRCNLNCKYCDTEFLVDENTKDYSPEELLSAVRKLGLEDVHSISLTGGEPLLETEFLKNFLPLIRPNGKIYLETNATLGAKLREISDLIDIVSADIKLESSTGMKNLGSKHEDFFEACKGIETFAKIVFDKNITDAEIKETANLAKKYNLELILSPMMIGNKLSVESSFISSVLEKYLLYYDRVRVIPQVHKFLGVE